MATYGTFVNGVSLKAAEVNDFFVWKTFTGVVKQPGTLSTSTNVCRYALVNKLVYVCYYLKPSSSGTASNAVEVNLPITAASAVPRAEGFGYIRDQSTLTSYNVVPNLNSTTTVRFLTSSATTLTSYFGLANGPAITLAADDTLNFYVMYEAA